MEYKIILAPFPFLEIDKSKLRPLVVLSNTLETNTCIVGFITSKSITQMIESDILLPHSSEYQKLTGLVVESVLRLHKVSVIDRSTIKNEIGSLPKEFEYELKQKLQKLFNL